ncbi:S-layer homology domain-containing protein [Intestinimonas butyriciproducens]|uniref:S-layer homology domain-containing protein n=1 Tax=Intestinimonas butyriciproducens TaxID=1297617 RepID=UPI002432D854|nr:S-layer homology domain-containing protein [Intestinimonas butyriciproducens]MCI6362878.1 S-layer homology domain-containing protein [Intestinimonas butyriciproducens]
MKKFKKFLSVLCAACMILAMSAPAFAMEYDDLLRNKPYDNITFTVGDITKSYPLSVKADEPCIRVWAQNTDTQGSFVVQLVNEDGTPEGGTVTLGAGESDYFDVNFYGDADESWEIQIFKKSGDVSRVSGVFAARMEDSWAIQSSFALAPTEEKHISNWATEEVDLAKRLGLLRSPYFDEVQLGTDYTDDISRLQFAGIMTAFVDAAKGIDAQFVDTVDSTVQFADTMNPAVLAAGRIGIVKGTGDGTTYSPERAITKEEIATMVYRAIKFVDINAVSATGDISKYEDDEIVSPWALEAVQSLVECGIMIGNDGNRLTPQDTTSIEEALVLTCRAFEQAIRPQAQQLAENYISKQKTDLVQRATSGILDSDGNFQINSMEIVDGLWMAENTCPFVLYSVDYCLKIGQSQGVEDVDSTLKNEGGTSTSPIILVLQRGAGGRYVCQGGFIASSSFREDNAAFRSEFKNFLDNGTALPYTYPQSGKIANTILAFDGKTYRYTPTSDMNIESIIRELTAQVMDSIMQRTDMTYQLVDYKIKTIDDIEWVEEDGSYWTAWPVVDMKYVGWYGMIGPSDGSTFISYFGTDGGMSRVRIDNKNGVYTLRCWAP